MPDFPQSFKVPAESTPLIEQLSTHFELAPDQLVPFALNILAAARLKGATQALLFNARGENVDQITLKTEPQIPNPEK
jgi:hypothetical protein